VSGLELAHSVALHRQVKRFTIEMLHPHRLEQGHAVTVLDNLSRGNVGALTQLSQAAEPNRFSFIRVDLGHRECRLVLRNDCRLCVVCAGTLYAIAGGSRSERKA
jgi:hypothetical protein